MGCDLTLGCIMGTQLPEAWLSPCWSEGLELGLSYLSLSPAADTDEDLETSPPLPPRADAPGPGWGLALPLHRTCCVGCGRALRPRG